MTAVPIRSRSRLQAALRASLALLLCAAYSMVAAQANPEAENAALERKVKAAYLYRFAGFVEWPGDAFEDRTSPIVIGVTGDEALVAELRETVAGKSINHRRVSVRAVQHGDSLDGLHIVFVGSMATDTAADVLTTVRGKPVLVVSDTDDVFSLGSTINFRMVDQRIRFDVALDTVAQQGINLSALMLTAAHRVLREGR